MKKVLMVAYHFPPLAGSSGIQRTLRFVQQLPEFGWEPIVLTAHPRAYQRVSDDLMRDIPDSTVVKRAFALDTSRHLSLAGRYPGYFALPDRWMTWKYGAVPAGLALVRRYRPDAVWSTYPIATAHWIGDALSRKSGLPWIADFRDPMAQPGYPKDPEAYKRFCEIESRAVSAARFTVFTTPGAAREYRRRYPAGSDRITVIENGFDEESFAGLPESADRPLNPGAITLLHSGVVYPMERNPTQLFAAIANLARTARIQPGEFLIRFRAASHDELLRQLAQRHGVDAYIEICPPVPYRDALVEMKSAEGLLVLQAGDCNDQIPAKLYEYLRAERPILALTDPRGDTAETVRRAGLDSIAPLDSAGAIGALLERFIDEARSGRATMPEARFVATASRRGRAQELAGLLDRATASQ
jgi:glycosyltransferase involved in cell wall biosynthesis